MRIYVAGPFSKGNQMQNVHTAIGAADMLVVKGHTPFIPHLTAFWSLVYSHPDDFWYAYDLEWLKVCDALLRLPGPSVGADNEVRQAKAQGKPVYYSLADVPEEVKLWKRCL